jgi:hypothetical protein
LQKDADRDFGAGQAGVVIRLRSLVHAREAITLAPRVGGAGRTERIAASGIELRKATGQLVRPLLRVEHQGSDFAQTLIISTPLGCGEPSQPLAAVSNRVLSHRYWRTLMDHRAITGQPALRTGMACNLGSARMRILPFSDAVLNKPLA